MSKPNPLSVLSIDIGHKRIGLAGCDPLGITVTRLNAIQRTTFNEDLLVFKSYCEERSVKGLIIGIPLDERGNTTEQSIHCQKYGVKIAKALNLPVAWVNEHSSSWEAGHKYNLQSDRTGKLDSACAYLLLEQWLKEGPQLQPVDISLKAFNKV